MKIKTPRPANGSSYITIQTIRVYKVSKCDDESIFAKYFVIISGGVQIRRISPEIQLRRILHVIYIHTTYLSNWLFHLGEVTNLKEQPFY